MNKNDEILDTLIIGGGIHGMYLFHLLSHKKGNSEKIKIADPHPKPLYNWRHCTSNTGMKFLRSPGVHHLDVDPFSLHKFCESHHSNHNHLFTTPNKRPALDLFNQHSKKVLSDYSIQDHWLQAQIRDIELSEHGAVVYTDNNEEYVTRHIILAIGSGGQLTFPCWVTNLRHRGFPVHHIYSHDFLLESFKPGFHTVVIGGGMGAVQTFIKVANLKSQSCTLISYDPVSVSQYDVEPGWMGPKNLSRFNKRNYKQRRRMINSARNKSTITPDVNKDLTQVLSLNHTKHIVGKVKTAEMFGTDSAYLTLESGDSIFCDTIILGSGFDSVLHNDLIQKLLNNHALQCAECGYPVVDPFLRWHPHLTVTGELAELELGPAAKNIIGARHAGERIQQLI